MNIINQYLALGLVSAVAIAANANNANADAGNLDSISFTTQEIYKQSLHVVSTDKKRWNKIKSGSIKFGAHFNIDMKQRPLTNSFVENVAMVLGQCGGASCYGKPLLFMDGPPGGTKNYTKQMAVNVPTSKIPVSGPGIASLPYGDGIIRKCNENLQVNGPTKRKQFTYFVHATVVADTSKGLMINNTSGWGGSSYEPAAKLASTFEIDHQISAPVKVTVVCEPVSVEPVDPVADDTDFHATRVQALLSNHKLKGTKPNPTTRCETGRILAKVTTTKAGPVKMRLSTKIGNAKPVSEIVQAMSKRRSDGSFSANVTRSVPVSRTTRIGANVRDLTNNKMGKPSGWKYLTVKCEHTGGGLAGNDVPPSTATQVSGNIQMSPKLRKRPGGARTGEIIIQLRSNKAKPTSYKLTCSGGRVWKGTLPTLQAGESYLATKTHRFRIRKTTEMGCALRSTSMNGNPVVALGSRTYVIAKRNQGLQVGGDGELTNGPRPAANVDKGKRRPFGKLRPKRKATKDRLLNKPNRRVETRRTFKKLKRPMRQSEREQATPNRRVFGNKRKHNAPAKRKFRRSG